MFGVMLGIVQVLGVGVPVIDCDVPEAERIRPRYLCLADAHATADCVRLDPEDARPFTLCLAETFDNEVERELGQQLGAALNRVRVATGASGASHLRSEQKWWDHQRNRRCRAEAEGASVPEQARAELTCLARTAIPRIAHLSALANGS